MARRRPWARPCSPASAAASTATSRKRLAHARRPRAMRRPWTVTAARRPMRAGWTRSGGCVAELDASAPGEDSGDNEQNGRRPMADGSVAGVASLKGKVSAEEWQARVELAALYRLVALYGWDDLIYTHISARIPGPD